MYKPRVTKPESGNPYYNTRSNGGYSTAIVGKPTDSGCNVLANCVGYAFGRFNEIAGNTAMTLLAPRNAELFVQIAKSSIDVAKIVISPNMKKKMNPQLVEFDCWYQNPIATSVLINSIILTPGTVTVEVKDERHFIVHALTDEAALGILDGTMQRKIAELFGE